MNVTPRVQELLRRVGIFTESDLNGLSEKEKVQLLLEVQKLATQDFLTGLPTRRFFEDELARLVRRFRKDEKRFTLGLVDVDFFKKINDTHGHLSGDLVLRDVARCLLRMTRPDDRICRWGGEEFVLFLGDVDNDMAFTIAEERIRKVIERSEFSSAQGGEIKVTVSIGLADSALFHFDVPPEHQIATLLTFADKALYEAKSGGRNQVRSAELPELKRQRRNFRWNFKWRFPGGVESKDT